MTPNSDDIRATIRGAIAGGDSRSDPYRHWRLRGLFPESLCDALRAMPFRPGDLGGVSGTREVHNDDRVYFSGANLDAFGCAHAVASAFQDPDVVGDIAGVFGAELDGCYLRVEYAQDVDGFWLQPHTDIGPKKLTMLIYVSDDPRHTDLGTDIYDANKRHTGRMPFEPNTAMAFVPSPITFHGFEKRPISGVRRSIIVNYVTDEWRAREQLAYPETPVFSAR